jgi:hypothetical protein
VFQLINTGSGAIECLGAATVVVGSTQDRSVHPCGARSWANAEVRRIVLSAGVLVVREESMACRTGSGIVISGTYEVDGATSTGTFAGACGEGDIVVTPASGTSHLSGKLKLAGPARSRRRREALLQRGLSSRAAAIEPPIQPECSAREGTPGSPYEPSPLMYTAKLPGLDSNQQPSGQQTARPRSAPAYTAISSGSGHARSAEITPGG